MARRNNPKKSGPTAARPGIARGGVVGTLLGHATGNTLAAGNVDPVQVAERYHRAGRFDEAEQIYRDILRRTPDHPRVNTLMGMLLNRRERHAEAVRLFKKSLKRDPNQPEAWNGMGTAYRSQGKLADAMDAYRKAIRLDPEFAGVHNNLGIAYREAGEFDRALESFSAALAIDPDLPEAWNGLARAKRFEEAPPNLDKLRQAATSGGLPTLSRKHALFALGKIHDDLGQFDDAFRYYALGNDLRSVPADAEPDCRLMENIAATFSGDTGIGLAASESAKDRPIPIFVLGLPRSGTTLVEQILASHRAVDGGGELNFFTEQARALGIDRDRPSIDDGVTSRIGEQAEKMRRDFFKRFPASGKTGKRRPSAVVDKTPFNFLYIGLISRVLPEARFVSCVRDPVDTGLSIFFTDFAVNQPFSTDLAAIGRYIRCYRRLMAHWKTNETLPILDMVYEDLVADQDGWTRKLLTFCGLEWDDQCLNYHKTERYISTPSDWQVRQPLYGRSISRWRHYESHIAPLISAIGEES